jgi:hypothetical protein
MRSWIAAGTLALVLAVALAIPAEAGGHRHSRHYGRRNSYAYGYTDRYRYPVYDNYAYRYRYSYAPYGYRSYAPYGYDSYAPYGYSSPYRYGAPYVLYAPPPPAYGYYYAPYRRHVRPHVSVTLGLW